MKLDSKYFDMIRIRRGRAEAREAPQAQANCQWRGCTNPGPHRAPKGRGKDGEYFLFCADHVRQYNASYNYFDGMSDSEVADFQKSAVYGHRPTWKMGAGAAPAGEAQPRESTEDPELTRFAQRRAANAQEFHAWRARQARAEAREPQRKIKTLERRSLEALHLPDSATKDEIKARFKALVKQHHPDVNQGDRGSEDKLREIIQAYNHLKQAGLV